MDAKPLPAEKWRLPSRRTWADYNAAAMLAADDYRNVFQSCHEWGGDSAVALNMYLRHCDPSGSGPMLDVGCGAAPLAICFAARLGIQVTAVDRDRGALSIARDQARRAGVEHLISFTCLDFRQSPLLSGDAHYPIVGALGVSAPYGGADGLSTLLAAVVAEDGVLLVDQTTVLAPASDVPHPAISCAPLTTVEVSRNFGRVDAAPTVDRLTRYETPDNTSRVRDEIAHIQSVDGWQVVYDLILLSH